MRKWFLGKKSIEDMIAGGEFQLAIDSIQSELGQSPVPGKSRALRQALAEALAGADRKVEAVSVLRDLGVEFVRAGQSEKAIAIQKRLEQLQPGEPAHDLDSLASAVVDPEALPDEAKDAASRSPLFSGFTKQELLAVIGGLQFRSFQPGELLMIEGEPGASLYVLTDGVVRVYVRGAAGLSVQIRELEAPAFFGEISIVYGKPRTATVSCTTYCELLELDRAAVDRIARDHPRVEEVLKEFCDKRSGSSEERQAREKS